LYYSNTAIIDTSKAKGLETHSHNGAFLAALSAMSLLYIVSRSAESAKTNSMTAHWSRVVTRSIPALIQEELQHSGTGTKVVVRNLFGNMPVRVKQRALLDDGVEDAEWAALVHAIIAHQLAWKKSVTIKIHNNTTAKFIHLQPKLGRRENAPKQAQTVATTKLDLTLCLLTQASLITADSWHSWVPFSAKTSLVNIRGAISLDACPTKHYQFIAIGIRPILYENHDNDLYDVINRLFYDSRFGVIDDSPDGVERMRRSKDRRYKSDGMTNKQLKGNTKGVDRWPMFDLHIDINGASESLFSSRTKTAEVAELQSILKVLVAMVKQWLAEYGFSTRRSTSKIKSAVQADAQGSSSQPAPATTAVDGNPLETSRSVTAPLSVVDANLAAEHRGRYSSKDKVSERPNRSSSSFQTWSRIKSGRPVVTAESTTKNKVLADIIIPPQVQQQNSTIDVALVAEDDQGQDVWITWQDPDTRQLFDLNTRSGLLVPALRPQTTPGISNNLYCPTSSHPSTGSSLRLESRSQGLVKSQHGSWLNNLVEHWDNPVFQAAEQSLEHVSLAALENHSTGQCAHRHDQDSSFLVQESRLSAHNLRKAKVISQLDNKFILIKMPSGAQANVENEKISDDDLLVIVDQHAADERCKVEELLGYLCESATAALPLRSNLRHEPQVRTSRLDKPIIFETSTAETALLRKHAGYFAKWGILYDILSSQSSGNTTKNIVKSKIAIQTLPRIIVERCTAEPRLVIELLRSEAWQKGNKSKHFSHTSQSDPSDVQFVHYWLEKIGDCPKGILEMVNSRACRSAIMFNDVLTIEECNTLIDKLADCAFPFQCAHGRPSMVPLIGMSTFDSLRENSGGGAVYAGVCQGVDVTVGRGYEGGEGELVQAFRRWQKQDQR